MRASASAGAPANLPIGVIGEKADLTYDYAYLGAGPETLATFMSHEQGEARTPDLADRAGRARAAGRRRDPRDGGEGRRRGRRDQGRLERLLGAAHRGVARRRARYRLRAGAGRQVGARDGEARRARCRVPARRRRDRHRARRVHGLHRHAWRSRRASRRRHPAGRGLHGKIRHSTSTPKAACRWRRAPRSRRAMRARTGRSCARCPMCSGRSCPTTRSAACAPRCSRRIRISRAVDQIAPGNAADIEKLAGGGASADKAPFRSPVADFYLTNPIARASAVMAECSALARGDRALTAAE